MDKKDLMRAIGHIDDKYIIEANSRKKKKRIWENRAFLSAASLFLCFGIGAVAYRQMMENQKSSDTESARGYEAEIMEEEVAGRNGIKNEAISNLIGDLQSITTNKSAAEENAEDFVQENAGGSFAEEGIKTKQEEEACKEEYSDESYDGTRFQNKEDEGEYVSEASSENQELTWEQVKALENYGVYVENVLPGFVFESASLSDQSLFVIFTRGYDYLEIRCSQADESLSDVLADVNAPREYDCSLYEIPYAETVPSELLIRFMHPVFPVQDLTLEILEKRVGTSDEGSQALTFGVVYSNLQIVEYNAKGVTPQELMEIMIFENN